jgi:ATP-dependent RNA helicase RhlE
VFDSLSDFKLTPKYRILIIANEEGEDLNVADFPCVIHFDIPEDGMVYTQNVLIRAETQLDQLALTFCTDLELTNIRKLEQIQGKKMQVMELPAELFIDHVKTKSEAAAFDAGEAMKHKKRG